MSHNMSLESASNLGEDKFVHFDLDAMGGVEEEAELDHAAWAPQAALELLRDATSDRFEKQGEKLRTMKHMMNMVVKKHLVELGTLIQEHGSLEVGGPAQKMSFFKWPQSYF